MKEVLPTKLWGWSIAARETGALRLVKFAIQIGLAGQERRWNTWNLLYPICGRIC